MKYARYRPKRDPDKRPKPPERPTTPEAKRVLAKAEAAYRAAALTRSIPPDTPCRCAPR